jgi:hypothetical protein
MMVVVADAHASKRIDEARRRAELVLPRAVDLWGLSWDRDDDALDVEPGTGPRDACLPDSFPDHARLADADITFVRARKGGLVHAMSAVFDDPLSAHQAWLQLGDGPFVTCFAESVVAAVELDGPVELLGPIVHPVQPVAPVPGARNHPTVAGATGNRRTARSRVTLSAASDTALLPIAIEVAVIVAGPVVVMLWAVERPGPAKDKGWARLVERVERKCEVAAGAP